MICKIFYLCSEFLVALNCCTVPRFPPVKRYEQPQPTLSAIAPTADNHNLFTDTVPRIDNYATGYWSEYASGVMDIVVANRIQMGQVPANIRDIYGDRFIAVYWYEDALQEYVATFPDGTTETVYAIDWHNSAHQAQDASFFLSNNIIGELDYNLARRHGVGSLSRTGILSK